MKTMFQDCMTEYGVDAQSVKDHTIPADKKCVYKCMAVKLGAMDESGKIDYTMLEEDMKKYGPPGAVDALKVCSQQKIDEACEAAENLCKCMKDQLFPW